MQPNLNLAHWPLSKSVFLSFSLFLSEMVYCLIHLIFLKAPTVRPNGPWWKKNLIWNVVLWFVFWVKVFSKIWRIMYQLEHSQLSTSDQWKCHMCIQICVNLLRGQLCQKINKTIKKRIEQTSHVLLGCWSNQRDNACVKAYASFDWFYNKFSSNS